MDALVVVMRTMILALVSQRALPPSLLSMAHARGWRRQSQMKSLRHRQAIQQFGLQQLVPLREVR